MSIHRPETAPPSVPATTTPQPRMRKPPPKVRAAQFDIYRHACVGCGLYARNTDLSEPGQPEQKIVGGEAKVIDVKPTDISK